MEWEWLNAALAIVSIATLAGLGLLRGTVTNLREQLNDERAHSKALKERRDEDALKIQTLEADFAALQRVVTGEVHWVALGDLLNRHHEQAMEYWDKFESTLEEILEELAKDDDDA